MFVMTSPAILNTKLMHFAHNIKCYEYFCFVLESFSEEYYFLFTPNFRLFYIVSYRISMTNFLKQNKPKFISKKMPYIMCHSSLTPTATATDPPSSKSPTMHKKAC